MIKVSGQKKKGSCCCCSCLIVLVLHSEWHHCGIIKEYKKPTVTIMPMDGQQ